MQPCHPLPIATRRPLLNAHDRKSATKKAATSSLRVRFSELLPVLVYWTCAAACLVSEATERLTRNRRVGKPSVELRSPNRNVIGEPEGARGLQ